MDEALGIVALDGAAITLLLTLAVTGSSDALAVVGIVAVAIAGTAGVVKVSRVPGDASRAAAQTTRFVPQPPPHPTPPVPLTGPVRPVMRQSIGLSYAGESRRPQLSVGQPMNLPVDHDLRMRLATAAAQQAAANPGDALGCTAAAAPATGKAR